jgi:hypothetical protein
LVDGILGDVHKQKRKHAECCKHLIKRHFLRMERTKERKGFANGSGLL